jgi:hypothetical protein
LCGRIVITSRPAFHAPCHIEPSGKRQSMIQVWLETTIRALDRLSSPSGCSILYPHFQSSIAERGVMSMPLAAKKDPGPNSENCWSDALQEMLDDVC